MIPIPDPGSCGQAARPRLHAICAAGFPDADVLGCLRRSVPACLAAARRAYLQLGLTPEEVHRAGGDFVREIEDRLPGVLAALIVVAHLPAIRERCARHYRGRGASPQDADDLSQTAVLKVVAALFGSWPRGNVGAWVATVRDNVGRDAARRRSREAGRGLASIRSLDSAPARESGVGECEMWDALTALLSPPDLAVLRSLAGGASCPEIAAAVGLSADEVHAAVARGRRAVAAARL